MTPNKTVGVDEGGSSTKEKTEGVDKFSTGPNMHVKWKGSGYF